MVEPLTTDDLLRDILAELIAIKGGGRSLPESPESQFHRYLVRSTTVTIGAVPTLVVKQNARRVVLVLGTPASGTHRVAPRADLGSSSGIMLGTAGLPVTFTHREHGVLPSMEWWGISIAAGGPIEVIEVEIAKYPGV